ncbi:helix-turn-helix transcriptional regulator [Actinomycetospora rhizophila]|uniref:Helix-turn-helix transcriptional regulator n=1 Tax=Actinomycetospora rhizophila TaxID=1416876 RepID=A0ABV9ZB99_9PSEU
MTTCREAVLRHRVHTTDPDEAVGYQQAYARFRAGPIEREGFTFTLAGTSSEGLDISHMRHAARMEARAEPTPALTAVELVGGRLAVDDGRGEQDATLVLAPHWAGYASRWAGYLRMTSLDLGDVARIGAELSGLEPGEVRFATMTPLSAEHARYWSRLVSSVDRDLLAHDELMAIPLLRREALHRLVVGALAVFPNSTQGDEPRRRDLGGEPATVRRAMAYIDAHADEDVTVSEVAQAARMGPRGLQAAFRRHRGQTPLEYLREVRMERAHRDLRAADPADGTTVRAVAARWGFSNAGRFSASYRRAYGCSPAETLAR